MSEPEELGIIGEICESGYPVIYRLVNELPGEDIRSRFPWLTVISWKYDGTERNGMPTKEINSGMLALEHAIDALEESGDCRHAYSRTGNGLKEFAYYIQERGQFMEAFNRVLRGHAEYPIEITFYEDPTWQDFQKVLEIFRQAG